MDREQMAFEETKMLQSIIARQDEFRARTKQWAATLVAALVTAALAGNPSPGQPLHLVNASLLWTVIAVVAVLFLFIETIFGSTENLAEERVAEVEQMLSEAGAPRYTGPRVCDAMRGRITPRRMFKSIRHPRSWGFYLALILFGGVLFLFR